MTGLLVALCLVLSTMSALADDETIVAGNGGTGECAANGGALAAGDVSSGENLDSLIKVGDTWGSADATGGTLANSTGLDAALDGGAGVCDASGVDENIAFKIEPTPTPAPVTVPPPPAPTPSPVTDAPIEDTEFRVCVDFAGSETMCLPGGCDASSQDITCTIPDCSLLPGNYPIPCSFPNCYVVENTGNCTVDVG